MVIDGRITILLTLKGRNFFTLRWLWHANRINLPFRVFIADGEVNPTIARLVGDPTIFPNLQLEYHQYSDLTFSDFYRKLEDALSKINTPYVMMSDNDDFLIPSGIIAALDYLDIAPEYESVGGGISHFEVRQGESLRPGLNGKVTRYWYKQSKAYQPYDLASSLVAERVVEGYASFLTFCYNVFRLEALRKITLEIAEFNFQRLDNAELFLILRAATLGKAKSDPSYISYIRQLGTSSNPSKGKDFVFSLSTEPCLEEMQKIIKKIALITSEADRVKEVEIVEKLNTISADRLRQKLISYLGWRATVKSILKNYMPPLPLIFLKTVGEILRTGKSSAAGGRSISREGIFKAMKIGGASEYLIVKQEQELIEVEHTLDSEDFIAFARAYAPALLSIEEGSCI